MSGATFSVRGAVILALIVAVAISGIAAGYGIGTSVPASSQRVTTNVTTTKTTTVGPYVLTLVITTNSIFNSTIGDKPAYFVVGPSGLESSAAINIPANRLIKLVIINYDDGAANLTDAKYASVTGVLGDRISLINNSLVNASQGASGIQIAGVQNVTSLSTDVIAHTFTIPSLGINIPLAASSTEVAYFTVKTAGTYTWFCMTTCGSGAKGLRGAMLTPGWMTGSVVVQ